MGSSLLSLINEEGSLGFGEACLYALVGFLIVFAGIVLIIFIIWLIGLILRKSNNLEFLSKFGKKIKGLFSKSNKKSGKTEDRPDNGSLNQNAQEDGGISDEVKVAIIAAIMAYYSEEKPECEFRVKRIKRI